MIGLNRVHMARSTRLVRHDEQNIRRFEPLHLTTHNVFLLDFAKKENAMETERWCESKDFLASFRAHVSIQQRSIASQARRPPAIFVLFGIHCLSKIRSCKGIISSNGFDTVQSEHKPKQR